MRGKRGLDKPFIVITEAVNPNDSSLGFFCSWITAFARELEPRPIEVWCLRSSAWPDQPSSVTVRSFGKGRLVVLSEFVSRILFGNYDGVFVHMSPIWMALGGLIWKLRGTRTALWYTHGTKTFALRVACLFAGTVFTATKDAFPLPQKNVRPIGHGIDEAFFEAGSGRAAHSIDGTRCLSVGRISRRKRVAESLSLFADLVQEDPHAMYRWIGEPRTDDDRSYFAEVRLEIVKLGLQDRVTFVGPLPPQTIVQEYLSSDLLIHLSATGSLDKVVLESLACGCPVFSTNSATKEADMESFWGGALDASAVHEMNRRVKAGVSPSKREALHRRFSTEQLVRMICSYFFSSIYVRD